MVFFFFLISISNLTYLRFTKCDCLENLVLRADSQLPFGATGRESSEGSRGSDKMIRLQNRLTGEHWETCCPASDESNCGADEHAVAFFS